MRNVRTWSIAAAAIVLLVLASGPGLFRSFAPAEIDSAQAARRAAVGAVIAVVLVAACVLWWSRFRPSNRLATGVFGIAGVVAAMALLVTLFAAMGASTATLPPGPDGPRTSRPPPNASASTVVDETIPPVGEIDDSPGPNLSWLGTVFKLLLAAVVLALVIKALAILHRNRAALLSIAPHDDTFLQPVPPNEPEIDNEAAADSFASSARALLDTGDPRQAIIAAYAALLEGLEQAGAGRRPHEAPEEHLRRSLTQLRIPAEALSGVTRLFLVAKFSNHPLGEADRDQARAMLDVAEQHLRTLAPTR
ncbi:MAG: DUF4129 domain-containing protein [Ilumatobacteraceae bacterium]